MTIDWIGDKESTLMTLAVFAAVGTLFGFLLGLGTGNLTLITTLGGGAGVFFWSLFAVQDLRLTRRARATRP